MPKSKVTDSCVQNMRNDRNAVKRIARVRRSVVANILLIGIPLAVSYLVMILGTEGGFAGYLALSVEQRYPGDLLCVLVTVVCFLLCHGSLLVLQLTAERQLDQARIDVRCQDGAEDTIGELEAVNMRVHKSYCNLIFTHLQEYYRLDRAMARLGLVILLIGITMSFLKLLNPVWLPFVLALVLDFMILIHRLHYSNSRRAVEEEAKVVTAFLYAQNVLQTAMTLPDGPVRNTLIEHAGEAMLKACPTDKDAPKAKAEECEKEDLPGLRLIFQKKNK